MCAIIFEVIAVSPETIMTLLAPDQPLLGALLNILWEGASTDTLESAACILWLMTKHSPEARLQLLRFC